MYLIIPAVLLIASSCVGLPLKEEEAQVFLEDNTGRLDNIDERGPYFEGDIVLDEGQEQESRAGIKDTSKRWPDNVVVYTISPLFSSSERQTIQEAMTEISSKTCIKFRQRSGSERAYVNVINSNSGCYSSVGRTGGAQNLNLGRGCVRKGVVEHEFIHAIGFYHEQARTDRDDYVTINYANVQGGRTNGNFAKYGSNRIDPFGVTYDYGSVMHYSAYAFAVIPVVRTIIVKQNGAQIGQRNGLSPKDAQKIKNMYRC